MSETTDPVAEVARELSEIERLALVDALETQAANKANDREIPGGEALVSLGPVANLEAWSNLVDSGEEGRLPYPDHLSDETDDSERPVLQTLLFWSEQWRVEWGAVSDLRPTVGSEAAFIRRVLNWAWEHEAKWDDFADDMRQARLSLENILYEGWRSEHGVQCFDCEVDLIRPSRERRTLHHCEGTDDGLCVWPHRFCAHDRGGLADEWRCPSCDRRYGVEDYYRAVRHAHFVHADYLPLEEAAERTGVKRGTIKVWAHREKVRRRKDHDSGRVTYHVGDIARHDAASEDVAS